MKKILKITAISLASLIIVVLIAILAAVWFVFTPSRLTPVVQKVLAENVTCKTSLDKVDLTFFSTFPNFSLKIENITFENAVDSSFSDTLLNVENCFATVNLMQFLKKNEVVLEKFYLKNGKINLFTDSLGQTNFDIFKTDTTKKETSTFKLPEFISLQNIDLDNVSINYLDKKSGISATGNDLKIGINGELINNDGKAELDLSLQNIDFELINSKIKAQTPKIELKINGTKDKNEIAGAILANIQSLIFTYENEKYVDNKDISINFPRTNINIDEKHTNLLFGFAEIIFDKKEIDLGGVVQKIDEDFNVDIELSTDYLNINDVAALLPQSWKNLQKTLSSMKFDGTTALNGRISGIYGENSIPQIFADVYLKNGKLLLKDLKDYPLSDINGEISAEIDLNKNAVSALNIRTLSLKTLNSSAVVSGKIDDLLDKMLCNVNLKGDLNLSDAKPMLPKDLKLDITGTSTIDANGIFTIDQISNADFKSIKLNAQLDTRNFDMLFNDSLHVAVPQTLVKILLPSPHKNSRFSELAQIDINAPNLDFSMIDLLSAKINASQMNVGISDITDEKTPFAVTCDYQMASLAANMDTISAKIASPKGTVTMFPSKENSANTGYDVSLSGQEFLAKMGKTTELNVANISLSGGATYNEKAENALLQWSPKLKATFANANVKNKDIKAKVAIPMIDFDFSPEKFVINKSRIVIDNSDFNLSGIITNIDKYLNNSGLLTANVNFTSDKTNVKELMEIVSGFGASDTIKNEKPESGDTEPFMVPFGVDITVNTNVSRAILNTTELQNVGGTLIVKDGVLVLEQMGFTCEAARMQLTAMYRSQRKNHLFVGLDFHLLDIEFEKLLQMFPQIDTIAPFLSSFAGKGEFHLAAETYLKSDYSIKTSTIRGASAISGENLVLLPSETFDNIAKYLMFKKQTQNIVDSLNIEMTLFRDEVELFPCLLAIDKYRVFVSGRYSYPTLTQRYNLHAEAVAPLKIGLNISGTDFSGRRNYKIVKTQYANLYNPEKRNPTQQHILELKQMISSALKNNVK
ncbi:MAG: AsmA family protein [Prevotellaceae bacterium]|jgi:hypothetical protein|nr:AsmA family protein [Prevotellaceae bacterium]